MKMEEFEEKARERYETKSKTYLFVIWGLFFPCALFLFSGMIFYGNYLLKIMGVILIILSFKSLKILQYKTELLLGRK